MADGLFSVKGKNIVLTGSSGLLGSAYAKALIKRGANMALIDINTKVSKNPIDSPITRANHRNNTAAVGKVDPRNEIS